MASLNKAKSEDDLDQTTHSIDFVSEKPPLSQTPPSPPRQLPQSDSGISLTPLSQASVLSPQQTVAEVSEDYKESDLGSGPPPPSSLSGVSPAPMQHEESAAASSLHPGTIPGGEDTSPSPDHGRRMSAHSGKCSPSPDDFTYQTKYLVLQFLHQSTTESHLLPLSHNSLSTTSESEPRFRSYAQRLREQWQKNRSQSSPTSPESRSRRRRAKLKGSRSSPNLKDAHFFKDMPPQRKPRPRQPPPPKAARGGRKTSSNLPKLSPAQAVAAASLIRSVSETTDNSETGTYTSDADDELDTSFDSSQQGSTTSVSLRNRLAHNHRQAFRTSLPTVQSETESVVEVPLGVAEESIVTEGTPLPIMDMSTNSMDHQPVSTADQFVRLRVVSYLDQMRETRANTSSADKPLLSFDRGAAHNNDNEEGGEGNTETKPPEHFMPRRDDASVLLEPSEQTEDGAVSGGFEPNSTSTGFLEETEGAWGGVDMTDDVGGDEVRYGGGRGDRSQLRLDIHDQDTVVLMEAVHSLRQEIEEEMSSFESELEEAMQSHHSDRSWSLQGLSRSQSGSPETAEIARRLARIGDEVQQKYFDHLDRAVGRLFLDNCAGLFTYENFREAAMTALETDLHGWKQVATVLLYSQHVALHLAQSGRRTLHKIIDYTVRLLADTAAEFIINQGGWASISTIGLSSTSSSPELSTTITPTFPPSGSADPRSRRSVSTPNLHTSPSPESPNSSVPLSLRPPPLGNRNSSVSFSASAMAGISLQSSSASHNEAGRREEEEEEEVDGQSAEAATAEEEASDSGAAASADVHSGINSSVFAGYAVSVAVIGVGVAVVLGFFRG
ncbi:hypothetical protein ACOMHN_029789 [Nucella lapillus]